MSGTVFALGFCRSLWLCPSKFSRRDSEIAGSSPPLFVLHTSAFCVDFHGGGGTSWLRDDLVVRRRDGILPVHPEGRVIGRGILMRRLEVFGVELRDSKVRWPVAETGSCWGLPNALRRMASIGRRQAA